ncbi:MAG: putative PEP-binding protein, partial [Candidatus Adiutrix sp.]
YKTKTPVSICGDMAAGLVTAPILIGLGATILSMPPGAIPKIKRIIRMSHFSEMQKWAEDSLNAKTASKAKSLALKQISKKFPELF